MSATVSTAGTRGYLPAPDLQSRLSFIDLCCIVTEETMDKLSELTSSYAAQPQLHLTPHAIPHAQVSHLQSTIDALIAQLHCLQAIVREQKTNHDDDEDDDGEEIEQRDRNHAHEQPIATAEPPPASGPTKEPTDVHPVAEKFDSTDKENVHQAAQPPSSVPPLLSARPADGALRYRPLPFRARQSLLRLRLFHQRYADVVDVPFRVPFTSTIALLAPADALGLSVPVRADSDLVGGGQSSDAVAIPPWPE